MPTSPPRKTDRKIRDLIDELCEAIGPRASGSAQEGEAARLLRDKLEGLGLETRLESFLVAPTAFRGGLLLLFLNYWVSLIVYYFDPKLSAALLALAFAALLVRSLFDLDLLGALLPKRWSTNVIGRVPPLGERRHLLVISGHHDSAFNMPLLRSPRLYPVLIALVALLLLSTVALAGLSFWRGYLGGEGARSIGELLILAVCWVSAVVAVVIARGTIRSDAVPGANDNLSAVAVAWELGQELAHSPPEHTEVWLVSFGSEELGLKGSRDFVKKHKESLEKAIVINLESLGQTGQLYALTGELLSGARHSPQVIALSEAAAVEVGVSLKRRLLVPGLTDATSFSRRGLKATTLIRFNEGGYLDAYHTHDDSPKLIQEESLEEALSLCRQVLDTLEMTPPS